MIFQRNRRSVYFLLYLIDSDGGTFCLEFLTVLVSFPDKPLKNLRLHVAFHVLLFSYTCVFLESLAALMSFLTQKKL